MIEEDNLTGRIVPDHTSTSDHHRRPSSTLTSSYELSPPSRPRQCNRKPDCGAPSVVLWVVTVAAVLNSLPSAASATRSGIGTTDSSLDLSTGLTKGRQTYQLESQGSLGDIFSMDYDEVANISSEEWRNFSCQSMEVMSSLVVRL